MALLSSYRGLPRSIYVLFFVQVINRFGDFVVPFLSLFLVKKMGYSMGQAGLAATCCALAVIPGAYAGGKLSDHIGRKKAYVIFQSSAALILFSCGFLLNSKLLVPIIVSASFFSGGIRPILNALITDLLPPEQRQAGFSLSYLGINLGVAFGPLVAGFLFNHYLAWIFFGDGISSIMAVLLVLALIHEQPPEVSKHHADREKPETGTLLSVLRKRPEIILFLLFNMLYSITYTQHTFGLPVQLNETFGSNGPKYFGFMMSVNAMTVLLITLPLNHLTRQLKPLTIMALCGILYAIGFGMVFMIDTLWLFLLSTFIWSVGEVLAATSFGVYLANRSPQNFRARINAVSTAIFSLSAIIGTSGIGLFTDQFGLNALWPLLFVLSLFGAFCMKFFLED